MVMAIVTLIAAIAIPSYSQSVNRARVASATTDIRQTEIAIERFHTRNGRLPADLAEVERADVQDPWGHTYHYLLIEGMPNSVKGDARKDRNLVPINNDYDLFSMGKDGQFKKPLVAPQSLDDIVRGKSGGWVGLAADF